VTSPAAVARSAAFFLLGWSLGAMESWIVLYFLGVAVTLERVLTVKILGVAFNNLLLRAPARVT
jgi:hypothetical protein